MNPEHEELLIRLYNKNPLNRDHLPYTVEFDRLCAQFVAQSHLPMTQHEVWEQLRDLGKNGRLPQKGRGGQDA